MAHDAFRRDPDQKLTSNTPRQAPACRRNWRAIMRAMLHVPQAGAQIVVAGNDRQQGR